MKPPRTFGVEREATATASARSTGRSDPFASSPPPPASRSSAFASARLLGVTIARFAISSLAAAASARSSRASAKVADHRSKVIASAA
jgi:hypothetical protein